MSKRGRKSPQKSSSPPVTSLQPSQTQKRGNLELFMECVDEDLAPSQKEAECKAQTEYQSAVECVEYAKSTTKTPRRSRPPSGAAAAAANNVESRSSHRGRGRGRGRGTPMTVEPGEHIMCTWLIANSNDMRWTLAVDVLVNKFCSFIYIYIYIHTHTQTLCRKKDS